MSAWSIILDSLEFSIIMIIPIDIYLYISLIETTRMCQPGLLFSKQTNAQMHIYDNMIYNVNFNARVWMWQHRHERYRLICIMHCLSSLFRKGREAMKLTTMWNSTRNDLKEMYNIITTIFHSYCYFYATGARRKWWTSAMDLPFLHICELAGLITGCALFFMWET